MTINDLTWKPHPAHLGEQATVTFPNGYGASVLRGGQPFTYTQHGTYELVVLHRGKLCYNTPITSDVLAYRTADQINAALYEIENLPAQSGPTPS